MYRTPIENAGRGGVASFSCLSMLDAALNVATAVRKLDASATSAARRRQNWAGNHTFRATKFHAPQTIERLQAIVRRADRIRAIGSCHSFSGCADCEDGELVTLDALPPVLELDESARTVTTSAGMRLAALAEFLEGRGWALHAMPSLPHLSVAGAVATATHGSGDTCGNLASAVVAMQIVDGEGSLECCTSGGLAALQRPQESDPMLQTVVLGGAGIIVQLTLRVERSYRVRQDVYLHLAWEPHLNEEDYLREVLGAAYSVSLFTDWSESGVQQVWLKHRLPPSLTDPPAGVDPLRQLPAPPPTLHGALLSAKATHMISGVDAASCTLQGEPAGPWSERLCHFRAEASPSAQGNELQSEYFVPRECGVAALRAMREAWNTAEWVAGLNGPAYKVLPPLLQVSEIRTVAADELWLSPCYRRPSLALHFTWVHDLVKVSAALRVVEAALAPFAARPHWGKLFLIGAPQLATLYPKLADYRKLLARLDPAAKFRNAFLDAHVFGGPTGVAALQLPPEEDAAPCPFQGHAMRGRSPRPYDLLGGVGHVRGRMDEATDEADASAPHEKGGTGARTL